MTKACSQIEVEVFRSERRADMYVYVAAGTSFQSLPEALQMQFGKAEVFLKFELTRTRYLAQAEPEVVLKAIAEQGFYLQLPPNQESARETNKT
ncbi:MAG: YcgL domain-containing protein [Pseudomonadota bacterium]|nr:YcgL domain-containing protein [Pseudomonadota bacterium]